MADLVTQIDEAPRKPMDPGDFSALAVRETRLSRLLVVYIATGLLFMLLPGTFFGVWNLIAISGRRAAGSVPAAWIQAHGHAQIFGWIGTFILGIGFYSIPKLRRLDPASLSSGWAVWAMWTAGVTLRWWTGISGWHWEILLPVSAVLELTAFLMFLRCVSGHRPADAAKKNLEEWVLVVIAATMGLLLTLLVNLAATIVVAWSSSSPALPPRFDQRFLVLETWGFLAPFVWGFSARWLPVFLGLRPVRGRLLLAAAGWNGAGALAALAGWMPVAAILSLIGMAAAIAALGLLERPLRPPKLKGVTSSLPVFVRLAYLWGAVAASLGIWAALASDSAGIGGASRHALTVGFLATMVFAIGQRVLPAFSGMRLLFSTRLMFLSMALLAVGCLLRVSSEILAYQGILQAAWSWLPVSAFAEMTAVTLFAANLFVTFGRSRPNAAADARMPL